MKPEVLTEKLIGAFYTPYNELGHGFLESIYQRGYAFMLKDEGLPFVEQAPVRVAPWSRFPPDPFNPCSCC